jgi:hypothetical protein
MVFLPEVSLFGSGVLRGVSRAEFLGREYRTRGPLHHGDAAVGEAELGELQYRWGWTLLKAVESTLIRWPAAKT